MHREHRVSIYPHSWSVGIGLSNILMVSVFIVLMVAMGWFVPRGLGVTKADATAVEMEVIVRNINLALMLKVSLFPVVAGQSSALGDTVLFALLLYGAVQLLLGGVLIPIKRLRSESPAV